MENTPSIVTNNLTCRYGDRVAVDNLSMEVNSGEFFGFLGPNGAGKSTTIRMLTGLLEPTSGSATVAGCEIGSFSRTLKSRIGIVSEETTLYERLTSAEFLEFAGEMHGLSREEARFRATDLLTLMDLTDARDRLIADYSMGMRKKTALAAALIHGPRVLFLDEPFNGLDPFSVRTVARALKELTSERGVTIFFTSHILEAMERLCDRVAILKRGKLRAVGTLEELRSEAGSAADAPLEEVYRALVGASAATTPTFDWWK